MTESRLRRWVRLTARRLGLSRNPLCRTSDRMEGMLVVATLLAAMIAVPVAISVGRSAYADGRQTADLTLMRWTGEAEKPFVPATEDDVRALAAAPAVR